jgi:FkbM family methyltransferase
VIGVDVDGISFLVDTADLGVGRSLFVNRSRSELDVLRRVLALAGPARGMLVDVGANIGTTTLAALSLHGFERALAVEPEPANVALLRANAALNGLDERVVIEPLAASDRSGRAMLARHPANSGRHRLRNGAGRKTMTEVPTATLDELLERHAIDPAGVGLLWIDVQGHELPVLEGAMRLLDASVPLVLEVTRSSPGLSGVLGRRYGRVVDMRSDASMSVAALDALPSALAEARSSGRSGVTDVLVLPA